MIEYTEGAELPDLALDLYDGTGDIIDFSSGYAFSVKAGPQGGEAAFTKTSGITGDSVSPNLRIAWATTNELDQLSPGEYVLEVWARRNADNKDRMFRFPLRIVAALI